MGYFWIELIFKLEKVLNFFFGSVDMMIDIFLGKFWGNYFSCFLLFFVDSWLSEFRMSIICILV